VQLKKVSIIWQGKKQAPAPVTLKITDSCILNAIYFSYWILLWHL